MKFVTPENWVPKGVSSLEPAADLAVRDTQNTLVVAGPGAGKTELLAQRASFLLETGACRAPHRILAISFKRDAASNLRERVTQRCGHELARRFDSRTFDAFAKGLVDRFRRGLPPDYRPTQDYLVDVKLANVTPLRERLTSISATAGVSVAKIQGLDVAAFFRQGIAERAIDIHEKAEPGTDLALVRALWRSFLHETPRSVLQFQMIGALADLLLRKNPDLLNALRLTYRFVFLDEFQDTTGGQYRLLRTAFYGSPAVLTAVGDHKQRIMLWAGALAGVFDTFVADFGAQRRGLVMNYRSAPKLVAIQRHLITALDPDSPVPQCVDDGHAGEGECRVLDFPDDAAEAKYLAEQIAITVNDEGVKPTDICVLARQQPDQYGKRLIVDLQNYGVRSRVETDFQDLLAEPLTTLLTDVMRLGAAKRAPDAWQRTSRLLLTLRGLDESDLEPANAICDFTDFLSTVRERLPEVTSKQQIKELISEIIGFMGDAKFRHLHEQYLQGAFFTERTDACANFLAEARARCADWNAALDDFLGVGTVPIMTIHKCKGLEFHTIIFLGLEDYPFRNIANEIGEEDCNFFVAFSRAKKRVIFTFARVRQGRLQSRENVLRLYELLEKAGVAVEKF
jgi:DNA helicase-2/ATP-dependent DNA helicase PcrA